MSFFPPGLQKELVERLCAGSIVRRNLMEREGYAPYCLSCNTMHRLKWTPELSQFKCGSCGYVTAFPEDFLAIYKERWNK